MPRKRSNESQFKRRIWLVPLSVSRRKHSDVEIDAMKIVTIQKMLDRYSDSPSAPLFSDKTNRIRTLTTKVTKELVRIFDRKSRRESFSNMVIGVVKNRILARKRSQGNCGNSIDKSLIRNYFKPSTKYAKLIGNNLVT